MEYLQNPRPNFEQGDDDSDNPNFDIGAYDSLGSDNDVRYSDNDQSGLRGLWKCALSNVLFRTRQM